MGIHAISYFDESDPEFGLYEMTDFEEFCSAFCMREALEELARDRGFRAELTQPADNVEFADGVGGVGYGAYPCGQESGTCVYCATCGEHLHCGIDEQDCAARSQHGE